MSSTSTSASTARGVCSRASSVSVRPSGSVTFAYRAAEYFKWVGKTGLWMLAAGLLFPAGGTLTIFLSRGRILRKPGATQKMPSHFQALAQGRVRA